MSDQCRFLPPALSSSATASRCGVQMNWSTDVTERSRKPPSIRIVRSRASVSRVAAFTAMPDGPVDSLLLPENKATLTKVLTSHVVAGKWSASDIIDTAKSSPTGFYNFNAVSGDALSAQVKGDNVYIFDESGNASLVTIADVNQSNVGIPFSNKVLLPK